METGLIKTLHKRSTIHNELNEYLLVAKADNEVQKKVVNEKRLFSNLYGEKSIINTQPRITIASFSAREAMEETIIRYLQRICSRQQSFSVEINNYSGIPPHTIYLRVQNPQPFRQLAKQLLVIDDYINSCSCPPFKLAGQPGINIAAKLPEALYLKALIDYGQRTFHEVFMVNELVLSRKNHEYDTEKVINIFGLQPAEKTLYN